MTDLTYVDDELCDDCEHRIASDCTKHKERCVSMKHIGKAQVFTCTCFQEKTPTPVQRVPEDPRPPRLDFESLKICVAAIKQNCMDTDSCEKCLVFGPGVPHIFPEDMLLPRGGIDPIDVCPFAHMAECPPEGWSISQDPTEIFKDYLAEMEMMCAMEMESGHTMI